MSAVRQKTSGLGGQSPEAIQFIQAQAGCIESLNRLMARHDGPVQAVVQVPGWPPSEEALQAGRIGLWRAIPGFGPAQGAAFSTYAWTCIKRNYLPGCLPPCDDWRIGFSERLRRRGNREGAAGDFNRPE